MADIRKLYFDLIKDYDPFEDISEHENMTESEMLYNLEEIAENNDIDNCDTIEEEMIRDRFYTLIDLFHALGYHP
jgi:hypothetical protein